MAPTVHMRGTKTIFGLVLYLLVQSWTIVSSVPAAISVTHLGFQSIPFRGSKERNCCHPLIRSTLHTKSVTIDSEITSPEDPEVTAPSSISVEENIYKKELETLSRITTPSAILAITCYLTFPTVAFTLSTEIRNAFDGTSSMEGAEALNLILQDNSNQFIQNMHNMSSLNFLLLTGYTFAFVYRQQEKLCYALFEEVSAVKSLLEQVALSTEGRPFMYQSLLQSIRRYVQNDLKMVLPRNENLYTENRLSPSPCKEDVPALLLSTRPCDDPLETILYLTSVGEPSPIYSTVRELRKARSTRLGAMQRKVPELNLYLLYVLGFIAWITFPVVAAGSQTVGGQALLHQV